MDQKLICQENKDNKSISPVWDISEDIKCLSLIKR